FPAVGVPVFVLLGAGSGTDGLPRLGTRTRLAALVLAAALALVCYLPPLLRARLTRHALAHPAAAAADLRWARRLDPLSPDPYVAAYELTGSRAPIEHAARMEPQSVAFPFLLGEIDLSARRFARARRELLAARALYPRAPFIRQALARTAR